MNQTVHRRDVVLNSILPIGRRIPAAFRTRNPTNQNRVRRSDDPDVGQFEVVGFVPVKIHFTGIRGRTTSGGCQSLNKCSHFIETF